MATGDVMRMALKGTYLGEPFMTTFGLVEGAGGLTANPLADACNNVAAALGATPLEGFSSLLVINTIEAQDVQPGTRGRFELAVNLAGSETTARLPGQNALVISWRSDFKGPANRGRMYLAGAPDVTVDGNFYTSDILDPASAFASLLFDPYGPADGTDYQLVILSYVPGSSPRALRAAVPVTSFVVDNEVKTQRRRGQGVKIHRRRSA